MPYLAGNLFSMFSIGWTTHENTTQTLDKGSKQFIYGGGTGLGILYSSRSVTDI